MYLARLVATKSKKNKVTVDCDYIDNMRLNFNNEEMINFYHFGLKVRRLKTEDQLSQMELTIRILFFNSISLNIVKKYSQGKDKLPLIILAQVKAMS